MKRLPQLQLDGASIAKVRDFVAAHQQDSFVQERIERNVEGLAREFNPEEFWFVLMGCLLTTKQKSTKGTPVDRFMEEKPFPLSLEHCKVDTKSTVQRVITERGGIRFAPTISTRATKNMQWLSEGGWQKVHAHFAALAEKRNRRAAEMEDKRVEREAAMFADTAFAGIGPKQSRNLWQWLGLTRFEIPLDSRVINWVNANLSAQVDVDQLSGSRYYDAVLDYLQALCAGAGVLPCIFDAAAFDYENVQSTGAAKNAST